MRRAIFLAVIMTVCNIVCSRNWNVIADSICLKQKMFIDSMFHSRCIDSKEVRELYGYAIDDYGRIRKHKKITAHLDSVACDTDTLFFIESYRIIAPSHTRYSVFWIKSDDWRGALLYNNPSSRTTNWEYIDSWKELMVLCNQWDIEAIKEYEKEFVLCNGSDREQCFIRVILRSNEKFDIDVLFFKG